MDTLGDSVGGMPSCLCIDILVWLASVRRDCFHLWHPRLHHAGLWTQVTDVSEISDLPGPAFVNGRSFSTSHGVDFP